MTSDTLVFPNPNWMILLVCKHAHLPNALTWVNIDFCSPATARRFIETTLKYEWEFRRIAPVLTPAAPTHQYEQMPSQAHDPSLASHFYRMHNQTFLLNPCAGISHGRPSTLLSWTWSLMKARSGISSNLAQPFTRARGWTDSIFTVKGRRSQWPHFHPIHFILMRYISESHYYTPYSRMSSLDLSGQRSLWFFGENTHFGP